jgi:uncharacterized integral membrane protein
MLGLIRSVLSIIVAALTVVFAIANRHEVSLLWSPVHEPATLPLFVIVIAGMAFGFIIGAVMVWLNESKIRKDRRAKIKAIRKLEAKLDKDPETEQNIGSDLIINKN